MPMPAQVLGRAPLTGAAPRPKMRDWGPASPWLDLQTAAITLSGLGKAASPSVNWRFLIRQPTLPIASSIDYGRGRVCTRLTALRRPRHEPGPTTAAAQIFHRTILTPLSALLFFLMLGYKKLF